MTNKPTIQDVISAISAELTKKLTSFEPKKRPKTPDKKRTLDEEKDQLPY